jgi:hypothetical protein
MEWGDSLMFCKPPFGHHLDSEQHVLAEHLAGNTFTYQFLKNGGTELRSTAYFSVLYISQGAVS